MIPAVAKRSSPGPRSNFTFQTSTAPHHAADIRRAFCSPCANSVSTAKNISASSRKLRSFASRLRANRDNVTLLADLSPAFQTVSRLNWYVHIRLSLNARQKTKYSQNKSSSPSGVWDHYPKHSNPFQLLIRGLNVRG